jgi:CMP/dCMP kinase
MIIAIDGPAGAGKSSVAKEVAASLGLRYVDTGAMYRAVALAVLERGVGLSRTETISKLADGVDIQTSDGVVSLDGRDVTDRVRARDVTELVPVISAIPGVRRAMARRQRAAAEGGDVVMEGRDIGTAIVPDADVKVFLTASLEERARRRCRQLGLSCDAETLQRVSASIAARDAADSSRAESPLAAAQDAVVVDTTSIALDEVVDRIVALARLGGNA